jgi:hypothetical protein
MGSALLAVVGVYFMATSHAATLGRTLYVNTSSQLTSALANAKPGDTIKLADAVYSGTFNSTVSGTSWAPITVTGSRNAILDGGTQSGGYGFSLGSKNTTKSIGYWKLSGFTITNSNKGIIFDRVQNSSINNIYVHDIGDEGIHLRNFSSHNTVSNNLVTKTGLYDQRYGEGLYVGTAYSNWPSYTQGNPDLSNNNQLLGNNISYTGAESIDIKEATHAGLINGNTFNGHGMCPHSDSDCNSADSFIDMKGEGWTVSNNTASYMHTIWPDRTQKNDGYQVHAISAGSGEGSGTNNTFSHNTVSDLGGYGFNFVSGSNNRATCDNVVTGARGFGNIQCR